MQLGCQFSLQDETERKLKTNAELKQTFVIHNNNARKQAAV